MYLIQLISIVVELGNTPVKALYRGEASRAEK